MITAFLSFKFDNAAVEEVAQKVRELLDALNVRVVDGRDLAPDNSLNDQLRSRIAKCDFLVCICLKSGQSNYIQNEMGHASGAGRPVFVITDDVPTCSGLLSDQPKIVWDLARPIDFAASFVRSVHRMHTHGPAGWVFHPDPNDAEDSNEVYRDLNLLAPKFPLRRKSFQYDIILGRHPNARLRRRFYKAAFVIHFEAKLHDEKVVVETARTVDNFHETYRQLLKDHRSIYRYILKTTAPVPIDDEAFKVNHVKINGLPANWIGHESASGTGEHMQLVYQVPDASMVGELVSFDLEIETIVDKRRNEFTVIFGYPVRNLSTSLHHFNTDITDLDVVDVVTSTRPVAKKRLPGGKNGHGVSASLDGWVFADSAIVYVWDRDPAKNRWPFPNTTS